MAHRPAGHALAVLMGMAPDLHDVDHGEPDDDEELDEEDELDTEALLEAAVAQVGELALDY